MNQVRNTNLFFIILFYLILSKGMRAQESADMPHGENFNLDCDLCHTTETWQVNPQDMLFKHDDIGFALFGEHGKINCRDCHESLIFHHIGHNCADCHKDVHSGGLGIRCEQCHTPLNWDNRQDIFKLHENSRFPLLGVHAILDCQACHQREQQNEYVLTPVECQGCHLNDYMTSLNPAHQKAGFDLQCENCHRPNTVNWKNANYSHLFSFPLQGGHANLECIDCHKNIYSMTPNECSTCHQKDYNQAKDPDHLTFGFPKVCDRCHTIISWSGTSFDHISESGFALNGIHSQIQCLDCHVSNQLSGLPRECYGCHADEYQATTDPNHQQGGFSQNCLDCHNENTWSPATFDHNQTNFPLTGVHITINCSDCHTNGQFNGTPTNCYACHEKDYLNVEDPNHVANNFDKDCTQCHNTSAWEPASFDHNQTRFPLDGAHIAQSCSACHSTGYTNTPFECIRCHEQAYNATRDPNHTAAQFPTTCQDCHNTSTWTPAQWDHDGQYFPIYSGKHQEEWDNCIDCHVNPTNYSQFECITCHAHSNKAEVDDNHKDEPGYSYESQACKNCHPNGTADEGGE